MYEIKSRRLRSLKVVIVGEKLHGFDTDDIRNLEDLPRVAFIDEECGNLKVVIGDRELTKNINQMKKSGLSQAYRCPPWWQIL